MKVLLEMSRKEEYVSWMNDVEELDLIVNEGSDLPRGSDEPQ